MNIFTLNEMSLGRCSWMWAVFSSASFLCTSLVDGRQIDDGGSDSFNSPSSKSFGPVELAWGISEVHATLGKLFRFTIPKDAFDGDIFDTKVGEVDRISLPKWLIFDAANRTFTGLPFLKEDIGTHYIAVTVSGPQNTSANDVFSLTVAASSSQVRCSSEGAETILSLMLDVNWEAMNMAQRIELLSNFSNYMDIPVSNLTVSPMTGISALFDSSALVTGPGNAKEIKHPGVKMSAVVGCAGDLHGSHKDVVTFIDESARDGAMARFTGVDIVGWHFTTSKPVPTHRLRRQSDYFLHTSEPTPIEPSVAVVPQGPVEPTPLLPPSSVVVQTHTVPVESSVYPAVRPTASLDHAVLPTASVDENATSPLVTIPPPVCHCVGPCWQPHCTMYNGIKKD